MTGVDPAGLPVRVLRLFDSWTSAFMSSTRALNCHTFKVKMYSMEIR